MPVEFLCHYFTSKSKGLCKTPPSFILVDNWIYFHGYVTKKGEIYLWKKVGLAGWGWGEEGPVKVLCIKVPTQSRIMTELKNWRLNWGEKTDVTYHWQLRGRRGCGSKVQSPSDSSLCAVKSGLQSHSPPHPRPAPNHPAIKNGVQCVTCNPQPFFHLFSTTHNIHLESTHPSAALTLFPSQAPPPVTRDNERAIM